MKSNHPYNTFLKQEQKGALLIAKKETPGSVNFILEINTFFSGFSRFFKQPFQKLSLTDPFSTQEVHKLKDNFSAISDLITYMEENKRKLEEITLANQRLKANFDRLLEENKKAIETINTLKEELDEAKNRKKTLDPTSPKADFAYYQNQFSRKTADSSENNEILMNKLQQNKEEIREIMNKLNFKDLKLNDLQKKLEISVNKNFGFEKEISRLQEELIKAQKRTSNNNINLLIEQQTPKGNNNPLEANNLQKALENRMKNDVFKSTFPMKNPKKLEENIEDLKKAITILEEDKEELKVQLMSSQEEIERLNKLNKELQQKLEKQPFRTSNFEKFQIKQKNDFKPEIPINQEKTNDLELENKRLKDKLADKKAKIRNLSTEVEKYNEEKEEIKKKLSSSKRKYKKQQEEFEDLEKNLIKTQKENEKLEKFKAEFDNLQKPIIKKDVNNNKKPRKPKPYDYIINIDSLQAREIGWEIEIFNEEAINLDNLYSIIGLVGPEKSGKTFILNKLCEFRLPEKLSTKGLSVKYAENNSLVCLDSAGMQRPVGYYEEKSMARYNNINREEIAKNAEIRLKMLNDRTITDIFIQDFILDVCEVIIIVVGSLTQDDQKLIERISKKYKLKKKIIVIHNFANIAEIKDIEERINCDIIKAFNTVERNIPNTDLKEYIEKNQEKLENMVHLVLGAENQDSGFKYNEKTIKYLQNILDTRIDKTNFDIFKELKTFFEENYRLYLQFKKTPKKVSLLTSKSDKNVMKIKTDQEYEVSNPTFNSLGNMITNPPFEVFVRKDQYIILIELPDLKINSLKVKLDRKKAEMICLNVEGNKYFANYGQEENEAILGNRKCGDFNCLIPLGNGGKLRIENQQDFQKNYDAGVLKIIVWREEFEEEKL